MTKKQGEKSEKNKGSAVAKPKGGKTHDVSVDERDDQPSDEVPDWADSKHEAGTKDESAQSSGSYSYESASDDGKEEERDRQLEKEYAKFRGARPDHSDGSDESRPRHNNHLKDAKRKAE